MAALADRFRSLFNAFASQDAPYRDLPQPSYSGFYSGGFTSRPDRARLRVANEKTIISSVYTRISIDISTISMRHTRHDDQDRYVEDVDSGLNNCLRVEANIDQAANSFMQDIVLMCFDKGVAAVVPVDTTMDPRYTGAYDIKTMRVGEITNWAPSHVEVNLYDERFGVKKKIWLPKSMVAIIENPFYQTMNEPNSTLQRLMLKLSLLDSVDQASSSGKLDLIIQLPYVVKTPERRQQAEQRAKDIEFQLRTNSHGIAYTDGTEKITQLNRPVENNMLAQIEYLTNLLFGQLGVTPEVMNGTASEAAMLNYTNRTVKPLLDAIKQEFQRKFLTKTARSQGQTLDYFTNPFALLPMSQLADIVDKLSRNEVIAANEFRGYLGLKPSSDPKADQLINSNLVADTTGVQIPQADAAAPPAEPSAAPSAPSALSATPAVDITKKSAAAEAFLNAGGIATHSDGGKASRPATLSELRHRLVDVNHRDS